MEHLIPSYRDPLFSILLIVGLSFIIALVTYGWSLYRQQREQGRLLKFLDRFESSECALDTANMTFEPQLFKPLSLLAKAFETSGEYPKAINLYLFLIKHQDNEALKLELMERLGTTYLHAGFLERARSIYVEILRKRPRNSNVLKELGIVYEMMQRYDEAEEILEPLETLGEDVTQLRDYLYFLRIINHPSMPIPEKLTKLESLTLRRPELYRNVLKHLFLLDTQKAWHYTDTEKLDTILDILWFLPNSQLDLDIIANDQKLSTVYFAKGYLQKPATQSGIFAVDLIAEAKKNGFYEAGLEFSYLCQNCKHSFPVPFIRCPQCMNLYTLKVEKNIAKVSTQNNNSLF